MARKRKAGGDKERKQKKTRRMAQQCQNISKTSDASAELEPKQETGRIERQEIDQSKAFDLPVVRCYL